MRDGLHSWCRECQRQACRDWRVRNRAIDNAKRRAKTAGRRQPRVCTECGAEFNDRNANAVTCSKRCKGRRSYRLADKELLRERSRLRNRGRGSGKLRRRRAAVAAGDLRAADIRRLLAHRTYCPLCRKQMTEDAGPRQKHLDHIVPLAVGGTHTWGNVRVVCATCNLSRPHDGSDVVQETLWARVA
jgi:HNH endonuclease